MRALTGLVSLALLCWVAATVAIALDGWGWWAVFAALGAAAMVAGLLPVNERREVPAPPEKQEQEDAREQGRGEP